MLKKRPYWTKQQEGLSLLAAEFVSSG